MKSQQQDKNLPSYVLVTPARNEAALIEQTIKSVIRQTLLPVKWVIVSDGSTDGTDEIVKKYESEYEWINLLRMPERTERQFAGKAYAFNAGYSAVSDLNFDIIGNLDADITFDKEYFSFLLGKFAQDPELGVAGTPFTEEDVAYDYRFTNIDHVSGACQLFRRKCFESVGGYVPLNVGGIDLVAVTTARMRGWKTRTFTEKTCEHHRKIGSSGNVFQKAPFSSGYHDYLMGVDPVWQFFRSIYQLSNRPFFIKGCALFSGYLWAVLRRAERPVSREFIEFRKKENRGRLKQFFMRFRNRE
ncbi:MAG: glycosyl transferase [Nitrospira bacterium SG8_35_4]|nr:MAG: glycosyl transferase [Nitrospira bacterium SG8_35_4]